MNTAMQHRPANHGQIMWGIVLTAAGLLLLIDRLDLADIHLTSRLWPLFPLGLGLLRLIDPPASGHGCTRGRRSGAWLVFIGCWGLMNEFHTLGFDYQNSWPLVVIFSGLNIVWRSTEKSPKPAPDAGREA